MAFYHTNDVRSTLLPITLISWSVGMGMIEYPVGYQRTILSPLYSSIVFTFYTICTFFVYVQTEKVTWKIDSRFINFLYGLYYGSHVIISAFLIIISLVCSKKRNHCIMELEDINKITKGMGVVRSYKRFLVSQIWKIGILVVMMILMSIFLYFAIAQSSGTMEKSKIVRQLFFNLYPNFISTVNEIVFCSFNEMMTGSFEDLNSLLESLKEKSQKESDSRDMGNNLVQVDGVLNDVRMIEILYSIRKIYTRLTRVANRWNQINAVVILVFTVFSTLMLTIQIYAIHTLLSSQGILSLLNNYFIESFLVTIFLTGKLFIIVHSAVSLTSEAHQTCGILLDHLHPIASLRSEVRIFSTQLIQTPLRLSVLGLCTLDYTMIQQIFTIVATYSILFIQTIGLPQFNRTKHQGRAK